MYRDLIITCVEWICGILKKAMWGGVGGLEGGEGSHSHMVWGLEVVGAIEANS